MNMREIINLVEASAPEVSDYLALGIDADFATQYQAAKIPLKLATMYEKGRAQYPDIRFSEILYDFNSKKRHAREDRAHKKLVASLPELAEASGPITHEQACAIIANDDRLFGAINSHIYDNPDEFEDDAASSRDLLAILKRIKPTKHSPLYRGESTLRFVEHTRGFHSWSIARDTAEYFYNDSMRGTGRLYMLTVPVKGIDLNMVGIWRGRLRSESHYMGSQGEWLVLDGYPTKVIAEC